MEYDPIKNRLGKFFRKSTSLQILFFKLLDLLLLRTWHIHREIRKWARSEKDHRHVLDAGAGFGQYTYFMSSKYPTWSILAVDVNPVQVGTCNEFFRKLKQNNVLFKVADLTKFEEPESYDLVVCVDVMEHILEDVEVFRNFHKSMKPGSMLLISTPSDQGGSDVSSDSDQSFIGEHVRDGYNKQEIKDKLAGAGFSRVKARYSYGWPGQLSWKLSMKYPMLLLNTSFLFILILPFYYLLVFPFCILMNYLDTHMGHTSGTGLIVRAWK